MTTHAYAAAAVAVDLNVSQHRCDRMEWSGAAIGSTAHGAFIQSWDALRANGHSPETLASPRLALDRSQGQVVYPPGGITGLMPSHFCSGAARRL